MSPKSQKGDEGMVLVTSDKTDKGLLLFDLDNKNKKAVVLSKSADLFVRYIESENELYFIEDLPKKSKKN